MNLFVELLELFATLNTPEGIMAVALGLALGLTVGLLLCAALVVVLGKPRYYWRSDGWEIIERR